MPSPYTSQPDYAFWKRAFLRGNVDAFDPVTSVPFTISSQDMVATAGSCFAQHIARALMAEGFNYLVTEDRPRSMGATDENYGVFSARFGNVYTARQLLQLFDRAHGLFDPGEAIWLHPGEGERRFVDPFRPRIQRAGFASEEAVGVDRAEHFAAVREMFDRCDVFVFTLGLTEGWVSKIDGAVFPLAPGVHGGQMKPNRHAFQNFTVESMIADLSTFITKFRRINPNVRIILTVSPVALMATYENRHVLLSTIYSKSALRVVADVVVRSFEGVSYFPSYEIITGPQAPKNYLAPDLRDVSEDGVAAVMQIFKRHYLSCAAAPLRPDARRNVTITEQDRREFDEASAIVCDEEALDA